MINENIKVRTFAPKINKNAGFFSGHSVQTLSEILPNVNAFTCDKSIINIETVKHRHGNYLYEAIRVWYTETSPNKNN
jgi:hypothetical protein